MQRLKDAEARLRKQAEKNRKLKNDYDQQVEDAAELLKNMKANKKQNIELKERVRKLTQELEKVQADSEAAVAEKDEEISRLRMGYNELRKEFNRANEQQILIKDPSDVSIKMRRPPSSIALDQSDSQLIDPLLALQQQQEQQPQINTEELLRENSFLKQRLLVQQQRFSNKDLTALSQANRLLRAKVKQLESIVEQTVHENATQMHNLSKQSPHHILALQTIDEQKTQLMSLKEKSEAANADLHKLRLENRSLEERLEDLAKDKEREGMALEEQLKEAREDLAFQSNMRKRFEKFVKENIVKHVSDSWQRTQQLETKIREEGFSTGQKDFLMDEDKMTTGTFSERMQMAQSEAVAAVGLGLEQ